MLGAIVGDVIGSVYEGWPVKTKEFDILVPGTTYTDDTVLTIAIADAVLHQKDYEKMLRKYGRLKNPAKLKILTRKLTYSSKNSNP